MCPSLLENAIRIGGRRPTIRTSISGDNWLRSVDNHGAFLSQPSKNGSILVRFSTSLKPTMNDTMTVQNKHSTMVRATATTLPTCCVLCLIPTLDQNMCSGSGVSSTSRQKGLGWWIICSALALAFREVNDTKPASRGVPSSFPVMRVRAPDPTLRAPEPILCAEPLTRLAALPIPPLAASPTLPKDADCGSLELLLIDGPSDFCFLDFFGVDERKEEDENLEEVFSTMVLVSSFCITDSG
mmetsp:Transcript_20010/g.57450  ORF Transcript_20010/g.57450 Transcript_20010/m.57450 type:complete len:241 (-) Transcript_20010:657-1379(-)